MDALLSSGEDILRRIQANNAIDIAEIFLQSSNLLSCSIGTDITSPFRDITYSGFAIRIISSNQLGFASGTFSNVEATLTEALRNARLSRPLTDVQLPSPVSDHRKDIPLFDKALLALQIDDLLDILQSIENAGFHNLTNYQSTCDIHRVTENYVVMNTNDLIAKEKNTWLTAHCLIRQTREEMEKWGYAEIFTHQFSQEDIFAVGHRALDSVKRHFYRGSILSDREKLSPPITKSSLIWNHKAMADLLAFSFVPALSSSVHQNFETKRTQDTSVPILTQSLSILDDPHIHYGIGSHQIDQEGVTTKKRLLVDKGYLSSLLSTYLDDAKGGNAYRAQYFSDIQRSFEVYPHETPSNLVIDAPELEQKDIFDLPQGFYIQGIVGVHDANASTGEFSVSCSEAFMIDNGDKIPLKICHISGNIFELLNSVTAVSKHKELVHPVSAPFGIVLPMLMTEGGFSLLVK
ncbi:MAG: metallopeptidase TldD-related protein [Promethearchaeota archaeon]